jgi:hypothetical protein
MVKRMHMIVVTGLLVAAAMQTVSAQPEWAERRRIRAEGVHIRVGRDYVLPPDQVATRPVIVVGGSATIDGRMDDDLVVIGGSVRVGPTAQVRGDLVSMGGQLIVSDAAEITGEIHDVSIFWPELRFTLREWWWGIDDTWWAVFSLVGTLFRLALIMIGACFLALLAPGWIRRIEYTAADAPVASGLLGVTWQLLFVPLLVITVVGMIVTIIGIPLLLLVPFALLGLAIVWLAGFAAVAAQIGGGLRGRAQGPSGGSPVLDTAIGVALLGFITVIGHVLALGPSLFTPAAAAFVTAGLIIEYLAWTVGLGAALLAPFRHRRPSTPPPIPARASFTATA